VTVKVAFSTRMLPWINEQYPGGQEQADGRYVVTFKVADPASWLVQEMLQYGAEVEVLEPEGMRETSHELRRAI